MSVNPLPPQAYTKDTLVKAYQWLQHQNDSIREMATNPDILVGLFLKAKLQGESALDRPSIQNFKSELKSLAGMMGEFEVIDPSLAASAQTIKGGAVSSVTASEQNRAVEAKKPVSTPFFKDLDAQSIQMIHEVKNILNLGSEQEALRALIAVGHNHLKKIL